MEVLQRTANRGSITTGEYEIANSLKTEADNSEYLYRVISSGGNRKTWTISAWVKRTELVTSDGGTTIFAVNVSGNEGCLLRWSRENANYYDAIQIDIGAGGTNSRSYTTSVYRDTSAWYHIVLAVDTTQSTATDRFKLYVNGVLITDYASRNNPAQNFDTSNNQAANSCTQHIGAYTSGGQVYGKHSGYFAEVHHIDGTAYAASDFGEYDDDSGIWKPKAFSGSYGTNGFYLDFEDNTSAGKDTSGNNNNFSDANLNAADHATDTPTNNGCTLNVLASLEGTNDITEGALVSTGKAGGGGNFNGTYGTMGIDPFNSSVDWYWEIQTSVGTSGSLTDIGIGWIKESRITSGSTIYSDVYGDGISRYSSQTANAAGDIWGVLLETGATPVMKLYRNDSLIYTSTDGSGGVSFDTLMFPYITVKGTSVDARLNFLNPASSFSIASGNTDPNGYGNFEFDPKGGYALCTKNLAEYG